MTYDVLQTNNRPGSLPLRIGTVEATENEHQSGKALALAYLRYPCPCFSCLIVRPMDGAEVRT